MGKYRVGAPLGGGGMGVVVRATHLRHGGEVALKFLRRAGDPLGTAAARMLREARAAARVVDEHVVRLHDVDTLDDGSPYLVMELLRGESLAERVQRQGRLPWPEACALLAQACEGLEAAHAAGVLHRDLKPSNLFLAQQGGRVVVKLVDFGLAKETSGEPDATLTREGAVLGSPAYMAPEQIRDAKNIDARTDLWALGVTLYEALTGALPFAATSLLAMTSAIAADPPRDPLAIVPDLPPQVARLALWCLEKNPDARPQRARDLRDALLRLIEPGAPAPVAPAGARSPARPLLALALLLAVPAAWLALRPAPSAPAAAALPAPQASAAAEAASAAVPAAASASGAAAASALGAAARSAAAAASVPAAGAGQGRGKAGGAQEVPYDPRKDARR